jgi:hypothetical protein
MPRRYEVAVSSSVCLQAAPPRYWYEVTTSGLPPVRSASVTVCTTYLWKYSVLMDLSGRSDSTG